MDTQRRSHCSIDCGGPSVIHACNNYDLSKIKKERQMKYLLLLIPFLLIGCANIPKDDPAAQNPNIADAELVATIAALELSSEKDRKALTEVSTALDAFCGHEGAFDSLALVGLFKSKLGKLRDRRRVLILLLLLERAGTEINPSDYVAWGGLACALRNGIKRGLALE